MFLGAPELVAFKRIPVKNLWKANLENLLPKCPFREATVDP